MFDKSETVSLIEANYGQEHNHRDSLVKENEEVRDFYLPPLRRNRKSWFRCYFMPTLHIFLICVYTSIFLYYYKEQTRLLRNSPETLVKCEIILTRLE